MRGENRRRFRPSDFTLGSSPHARGKQSIKTPGACMARLIPACAGKTPWGRVGHAIRWAHPRMRGENATVEARRVFDGGSSPHARGKQHALPVHFNDVGLIPACAGKTPARPRFGPRARAHPRMRGENIDLIDGDKHRRGSSPHARGKRYSSL